MYRRLRSPVLVARAAELVTLDVLAARAGSGGGGFVLVRGEPGVGKSRLLAECLGRARAAGLATLSGRAVEGGGPYRPLSDALLARQREAPLPEPAAVGPFSRALAHLVPGWFLGPTDQPIPDLSLLVSEGLLRLLRLVGQPGGALLALDDLHWADADTLTVLDRLAEAVDGAGVLVVAAARDEPHPALDRLGGFPEVHVLRLGRLSRAEVTALASGCADAPMPAAVLRHVAEHADGLPFLVEEMLGGLVDAGVLVRTAAGWEVTRELHGTVPASFAAVVRGRLESLDPVARAVVEAAAVVGRQVDWRLLPAVIDQPEAVVLDALRVAVDRQLLVYGDQPDLFRFVHALTREAVLDRLLPPQRTAVARVVARLLDERGDDLELAADLHAAAGEHDRAAALLCQAARAAGSAVGTREQLLRRALELAPGDDVAAALTEVLVLAGRAADARELGDRVLGKLADGDPCQRSLALTLARASVVESRWAEAEGYLEQAGDGPDIDALAAHVTFGRQRPEEAERLARSAVAAAGDAPAVLCEALEVVGRCARLRDRCDEAEAAFARAAEVAQRHELVSWRVRALHELGTLDLLGPARPDRLEQARELAVAAGLLSTAAFVDLQLMGCHGLRVDLDATLAVALRGEELALSLRLPVLAAGAGIFAAMVYGHTGRHEEMRAALDLALDRVGDDLDLASFAHFIRGVPAMVAHDLAAWRPTLEDGMRLVRRVAAASPSPFRGLYALVETVVGDGRAAREELRGSGATVQAANRAALAYADAVAVARFGGDPWPHLAEAETAMASLTWRRHHARLLVAPAALRDGWGRPLHWLREANAHFDVTGDAALARACRDQLRAAGAPVPRKGRGDSEVPAHLRALGVTSREIDVLTLVAEGLGNAAIAERLYLSPRTVETHIANLLAKTGAARRGELANYVAAPA